MARTLLYNTRDGSGRDIVKEVVIKEHPVYQMDAVCSVCGAAVCEVCRTREVVSSDFTAWATVGEYVCRRCADLFSLYPYSYIVDPDGIRLLNLRELRAQLTSRQTPPFLFAITTSRKKHLFYDCKWNYSADRYAVNLEQETIYTAPGRMRILFDLVECLQTLGCSKDGLKKCDIPQQVSDKLGGINHAVLLWLYEELNSSREIQIPLYCGQKRDISEEVAICSIDSILTA